MQAQVALDPCLDLGLECDPGWESDLAWECYPGWESDLAWNVIQAGKVI